MHVRRQRGLNLFRYLTPSTLFVHQRIRVAIVGGLTVNHCVYRDDGRNLCGAPPKVFKTRILFFGKHPLFAELLRMMRVVS